MNEKFIPSNRKVNCNRNRNRGVFIKKGEYFYGLERTVMGPFDSKEIAISALAFEMAAQSFMRSHLFKGQAPVPSLESSIELYDRAVKRTEKRLKKIYEQA